ncbi:MAG: hypothetical protein KBA52_01110 [Candidatus Kapabacteria bacterium]|nr:hypothetical protein [Candidatus Kapabacteria bacterium]
MRFTNVETGLRPDSTKWDYINIDNVINVYGQLMNSPNLAMRFTNVETGLRPVSTKWDYINIDNVINVYGQLMNSPQPCNVIYKCRDRSKTCLYEMRLYKY